MRLVIDLQGAQGTSRLRGIGRLSRELALAMARDPGGNQVVVALNGLFPDVAAELMDDFSGSLDRDAIRVWQPAGGTAATSPDGELRRRASEHIRARFLQSLAPDLVHVSSLFEGAADDVVTGLPDAPWTPPSVATLYDLIPLIRRDQYLDGAWTGNSIRDWYLRGVEQVRRMPGLLAISESTRREAIDHLGMPPDRVFNIRAGVADVFRPVVLQGAAREDFLARYGLAEDYVLFLGGGDMRKNEAGLIAAYAMLPPELRARHRLVIVAKLDEAGLRATAVEAGLAPSELIVIPFVAEADLPSIYSLCALFVFPSFHEGFGLPAAEAMACGAPVIGSNGSSLPEVIGREDALFDPHQPASIAARMHQVLGDAGFARSLSESGLVHARGFTWAESARRAWAGLEAIAAQTKSRVPDAARQSLAPRRSLAVTSPLPPQQSGIADYTTQLLPALGAYYDITLVTPEPDDADPELRARYKILTPDAFAARAAGFDRVVHQIGNSVFHLFQIDRLLPQCSGVIVLHDVFLSNILQHAAGLEGAPEAFRRTLVMTHGIPGLQAEALRGSAAVVQELPCSLQQIRQSLGVIVHSRHAKALIEMFFGPALSAVTRIVPTTRNLPDLPDRAAARHRLGLPDTAMVVASFGGVADTKRPKSILSAYAASALSRSPEARLAFVGQAEPAVFERLEEQARLAGLGTSVVMTQRIATETYLDWLAAADIAVQLRTGSRGETSAAAADCLVAGVPTIVNAHGALAELPQDAVIMLPDRFDDAQLADAIDRLAASPDLRRSLAHAGRMHGAAHFSAADVALAYYRAIEDFYAAPTSAIAAHEVLRALPSEVGALAHDEATIGGIARALATSFPMPRPRRLMLDITAWDHRPAAQAGSWAAIATALLAATAPGDRGELMAWRDGAPVSAWGEAARLVGLESLTDLQGVADQQSGPAMPGDLLFCPVWPGAPDQESRALARWARLGGARVVAVAVSHDDQAAARPDTEAMIVIACGGPEAGFCADVMAALLALAHTPAPALNFA